MDGSYRWERPMSATRRVSVIVPTRDRPALLREALYSIRALEDSDLRFEILVGDNGADPQTPSVVADFGAIYLKVERQGAGAARNAGLNAATGEYCAFLDDDDIWLPDAVRAQLDLLDANPELEGVFGQIICTDEALQPTTEAWPQSLPDNDSDQIIREMLTGYYPQIGATLVRAPVREAIGLFDEALLGDQDWDWQLRLARRRKVGFAAKKCVLFRQRKPGTFDALRLARLGFARRVFFRHALPEWRLWKTPTALHRAYTLVLWQYFEYFREAAIERAQRGDARGARHALLGALKTFPLRTAAHVLKSKPLRAAFEGAFLRPRRPRAKALRGLDSR
jgi:glycosyltransferase involved in cell wall biosynthesis